MKDNVDIRAIREWLDGFDGKDIRDLPWDVIIESFHGALDEILSLREQLGAADVPDNDPYPNPGREYDKYEELERRQRAHPLYPEARR